MIQRKDRNRDLSFALNSDRVLRIYPRLAEEIGQNETIIPLQLDFLISIAGDDNYKDGRWWTYQSLRDLKDNHFCWMSLDTISRALKKLEARGLILIGNYNRRRSDKTQWFALNFDELAKLESISIAPHERGPGAVRILQRESEKRTASVSENGVKESEAAAEESEAAETALGNRTTLPESPEMTPERGEMCLSLPPRF